ncbi:MAG TPA: GNAT family protein [Ramlibacter sp.]|nr:GNAT family protein [Ramlibacter sp.]
MTAAEARSPVLLRPLEPRDSDALFRWINDRHTVVFNAPFEPVARADHDRWFDAIRRAGDVRIFAIVEVESDRLVGTCQLLNISRRHRSADLQIRIGEPDARGKGLGTHAVRELVRRGFGELGLHRIALTVRTDNERAIRTYRSCGFEAEGVAREAAFIEGRFVDLLCMAILAQ